MNLKNDVEEIWEDLKKYQTEKIWKTKISRILLQNNLKRSLGQYESTQKISAWYLKKSRSSLRNDGQTPRKSSIVIDFSSKPFYVTFGNIFLPLFNANNNKASFKTFEHALAVKNYYLIKCSRP